MTHAFFNPMTTGLEVIIFPPSKAQCPRLDIHCARAAYRPPVGVDRDGYCGCFIGELRPDQVKQGFCMALDALPLGLRRYVCHHRGSNSHACKGHSRKQTTAGKPFLRAGCSDRFGHSHCAISFADRVLVRAGVELALPSGLLMCYYITQQITTKMLENVVMAKGAPIGFRIDAEIKSALERAAKDDNRSLSSLVTIILMDWLKDRGYLPK
ncbi:MAG: hypothetical protein ACEPO2_14575 [Pelagibaca sp.]